MSLHMNVCNEFQKMLAEIEFICTQSKVLS